MEFFTTSDKKKTPLQSIIDQTPVSLQLTHLCADPPVQELIGFIDALDINLYLPKSFDFPLCHIYVEFQTAYVHPHIYGRIDLLNIKKISNNNFV
jgi:hypothetical protein